MRGSWGLKKGRCDPPKISSSCLMLDVYIASVRLKLGRYGLAHDGASISMCSVERWRSIPLTSITSLRHDSLLEPGGDEIGLWKGPRLDMRFALGAA